MKQTQYKYKIVSKYDSDIECICREVEVKYKQEAYKCMITNLNTLAEELGK